MMQGGLVHSNSQFYQFNQERAMSTFTETESYEFETYSFCYRPPQGSNPDAFFVVQRNRVDVLPLYRLTNQALGLRSFDGALQVGLATFPPDGSKEIEFALSTSGEALRFVIECNGSNHRAGIGIEDIRDAGFKPVFHYFDLDAEPISIRLDTKNGWLVVQMRDPATRAAGEAIWYTQVN